MVRWMFASAESHGIFLGLQASKDVLLNAMGVFLKEPLLDWERFAHRTNTQAERASKIARGETTAATLHRYAAVRLDIARRKLNRGNPTDIRSIHVLFCVSVDVRAC